MLDVHISECVPRGFLRLPVCTPYSRAQTRYLGNFALSPLNPLMSNGPHAYIVARREGRPVARLFAFSDNAASIHAPSGECTGFFSLIDGGDDLEAVRLMLNHMERMQAAWGNVRVIGPVAPDGSGFFHGLAVSNTHAWANVETCGDDFALHTRNQKHIESFLLQSGYIAIAEERAFQITLPNEDTLDELNVRCARACARFGVRTRPLRVCGNSRGDERAMHALSYTDSAHAPSLTDMERQIDHIGRFIAHRYSFIAEVGGMPAGFLLSLKRSHGGVRAATLMTARDRFSAPIALALMCALANALRAHRQNELEASLIDARNLPSLACVTRFHGETIGTYRRYAKKFNEN